MPCLDTIKPGARFMFSTGQMVEVVGEPFVANFESRVEVRFLRPGIVTQGYALISKLRLLTAEEMMRELAQ